MWPMASRLLCRTCLTTTMPLCRPCAMPYPPLHPALLHPNHSYLHKVGLASQEPDCSPQSRRQASGPPQRPTKVCWRFLYFRNTIQRISLVTSTTQAHPARIKPVDTTKVAKTIVDKLDSASKTLLASEEAFDWSVPPIPSVPPRVAARILPKPPPKPSLDEPDDAYLQVRGGKPAGPTRRPEWRD
jgi:hypothetical protein